MGGIVRGDLARFVNAVLILRRSRLRHKRKEAARDAHGHPGSALLSGGKAFQVTSACLGHIAGILQERKYVVNRTAGEDLSAGENS
jgi:hypothetical protein